MALPKPITWLRSIQSATADMPARSIVQFGSAFTATDDPSNDRTVIGISGPVQPSDSTWKTMNGTVAQALAASATAAGTYDMLPGGTLAAAISGNSGYMPFYLDPADYPAGPGGTVELRLEGWVITNAVAQAATFTFEVLPIATWGGGSGANPQVATYGSVLTSAAVVAPAAGGPTLVKSSTVSLPSSTGWYVLVCVISAAVATNGQCDLGCRLQYQQP